MMRATVPAAAPAVPAGGAAAPTQAAQSQTALTRVAYLFRRAGPDITMQALLRAMLEYRAEK